MVIQKGGAEGMLITHGGASLAGLDLLKGKPVFCYNLAGVTRCYVTGTKKLAPGAHTIVYDFNMTAASAKAAWGHYGGRRDRRHGPH